jgi:periplasmic divalent cation tolerance protein
MSRPPGAAAEWRGPSPGTAPGSSHGPRETNTIEGSEGAAPGIAVTPATTIIHARKERIPGIHDMSRCYTAERPIAPVLAARPDAEEDSLTETLIAFTTFGSEADAARVTRVLVEERLIACANLLPGARSIYRWQDSIQDEPEVVVLMKTRKQDWAAFMSRLHELHPYETPECVAVRVAAGAPKYLQWLDRALEPEGA